MNLEQIYLNRVKHNPVSNFSFGSMNTMPIIEKDPSIRKLEEDVFSKIREIDPPEIKQQPILSQVKTLSPEEAMKELLEIERNLSQSK